MPPKWSNNGDGRNNHPNNSGFGNRGGDRRRRPGGGQDRGQGRNNNSMDGGEDLPRVPQPGDRAYPPRQPPTGPAQTNYQNRRGFGNINGEEISMRVPQPGDRGLSSQQQHAAPTQPSYQNRQGFGNINGEEIPVRAQQPNEGGVGSQQQPARPFQQPTGFIQQPVGSIQRPTEPVQPSSQNDEGLDQAGQDSVIPTQPLFTLPSLQDLPHAAQIHRLEAEARDKKVDDSRTLYEAVKHIGSGGLGTSRFAGGPKLDLPPIPKQTLFGQEGRASHYQKKPNQVQQGAPAEGSEPQSGGPAAEEPSKASSSLKPNALPFTPIAISNWADEYDEPDNELASQKVIPQEELQGRHDHPKDFKELPLDDAAAIIDFAPPKALEKFADPSRPFVDDVAGETGSLTASAPANGHEIVAGALPESVKDVAGEVATAAVTGSAPTKADKVADSPPSKSPKGVFGEVPIVVVANSPPTRLEQEVAEASPEPIKDVAGELPIGVVTGPVPVKIEEEIAATTQQENAQLFSEQYPSAPQIPIADAHDTDRQTTRSIETAAGDPSVHDAENRRVSLPGGLPVEDVFIAGKTQMSKSPVLDEARDSIAEEIAPSPSALKPEPENESIDEHSQTTNQNIVQSQEQLGETPEPASPELSPSIEFELPHNVDLAAPSGSTQPSSSALLPSVDPNPSHGVDLPVATPIQAPAPAPAKPSRSWFEFLVLTGICITIILLAVLSVSVYCFLGSSHQFGVATNTTALDTMAPKLEAAILEFASLKQANQVAVTITNPSNAMRDITNTASYAVRERDSWLAVMRAHDVTLKTARSEYKYLADALPLAEKRELKRWLRRLVPASEQRRGSIQALAIKLQESSTAWPAYVERALQDLLVIDHEIESRTPPLRNLIEDYLCGITPRSWCRYPLLEQRRDVIVRLVLTAHALFANLRLHTSAISTETKAVTDPLYEVLITSGTLIGDDPRLNEELPWLLESDNGHLNGPFTFLGPSSSTQVRKQLGEFVSDHDDAKATFLALMGIVRETHAMANHTLSVIDSSMSYLNAMLTYLHDDCYGRELAKTWSTTTFIDETLGLLQMIQTQQLPPKQRKQLDIMEHWQEIREKAVRPSALKKLWSSNSAKPVVKSTEERAVKAMADLKEQEDIEREQGKPIIEVQV